MRSVVAAALAVTLSAGAQEAPARRWFKGNTHAHTLNSDGNASPEDVVRWYREHGYDFLVITDHDQITALGGSPGLLLIPGEEVTDRLPKRPLHVNALGPSRVIKPQGGATAVDVLQHDVDAVRAAGGVPAINHPNFGWAFGAGEIRQLERVHLLEIASGHPLVNMRGGGNAPSVESMWDAVLTSGMKMYGIAVDDAHDYDDKCAGDREAARPGQAWVVVRAEKLEPRAIVEAMDRGDFYASTGVTLDDVVAANPMTIRIQEQKGKKYTTYFLGRGGRVLFSTGANPATYRLRGDELYVRARVVDSNGREAWVQPMFVKK